MTNFGAFVDIGVHQDGLVHISAMTERFISDPRTVVKAGDVVRVRVVEVNQERRRIGLSMRLEEKPAVAVKPKPPVKPLPQEAKGAPPSKAQKKQPAKASRPQGEKKAPAFNTAMADAFAKLKKVT